MTRPIQRLRRWILRGLKAEVLANQTTQKSALEASTTLSYGCFVLPSSLHHEFHFLHVLNDKSIYRTRQRYLPPQVCPPPGNYLICPLPPLSKNIYLLDFAQNDHLWNNRNLAQSASSELIFGSFDSPESWLSNDTETASRDVDHADLRIDIAKRS